MTDEPLTISPDVEKALAALRPELHRYLARMTGSVFDGEDVVQDTLLAATRALSGGAEVRNLRAWLFRIGRNTALNTIRARRSEQAMKDRLTQFAQIAATLPQEGGHADAFRPLMALSPKQRSAVILFDILGYDAAEVADISEASVDAIKSALKRGRAVLRDAPEIDAPGLTEDDQALLERYTACFNAHDFDTIRAMLAEEVGLDVVSIETRKGAAPVGGYFTNYAKVDDWLMVPGQVEGHPTVLVFDRGLPGDGPAYVVRLTFDDQKIHAIQDFRYARYVMQDMHWQRLQNSGGHRV